MLEHQHIEAEMSKPKGGSNHDSPKHITVVKTPKTPRGSSIDLRKLVAKVCYQIEFWVRFKAQHAESENKCGVGDMQLA